MSEKEKFVGLNVTIDKDTLDKIDNLDEELMIQNRSATVRMILNEYFSQKETLKTVTELVKIALDEKQKEGKR